MQAKKNFLSAFSSMILIPAVMIIILIDKPDYKFFNFIHASIVPVMEIAGQGLTYPVRLVGKVAESIRRNRDVLKENIEITSELEGLEKIRIENEILRQENEALKSRLNMASSIKYKIVSSGIIHNNAFMDNQTFIIENPGRDISAGNIVLSNTGYLSGVVVENIGRYAKIRSIRDVNSNIPVRIAGTDVFGFLQGGGNYDPELRFLSNGDFFVKEGMFLITSSVNGNVPDNMPVGRVGSIKNGEIRVNIGADLRNMESVMILLFDKNGRYEDAKGDKSAPNGAGK